MVDPIHQKHQLEQVFEAVGGTFCPNTTAPTMSGQDWIHPDFLLHDHALVLSELGVVVVVVAVVVAVVFASVGDAHL